MSTYNVLRQLRKLSSLQYCSGNKRYVFYRLSNFTENRLTFAGHTIRPNIYSGLHSLLCIRSPTMYLC